MSFKDKYLKYKNKYLSLKNDLLFNQYGGAAGGGDEIWWRNDSITDEEGTKINIEANIFFMDNRITNFNGFDLLISNLQEAFNNFEKLRTTFIMNKPTEKFVNDYLEIESKFKNDMNLEKIQTWKNMSETFLKTYPKICINKGSRFDLTKEHTDMVEKGRQLFTLYSQLFNLYGPGTNDPFTFIKEGQDRFDSLFNTIREMIIIIEKIKIIYTDFLPLFRIYRTNLDHCFRFKPLSLKMRMSMPSLPPEPSINIEGDGRVRMSMPSSPPEPSINAGGGARVRMSMPSSPPEPSINAGGGARVRMSMPSSPPEPTMDK